MAVVMVAFAIYFLAASGLVGVNTGDTEALSVASEILGGATLAATFWMSSTATGGMEL